MNKKIAIILGEPNSINSELIGKIWKKNKKIFDNVYIIGNKKLLEKQFLKIGFKNIKINKINDLDNRISSSSINIINIDLKFKDCFNVSKENSRTYLKKCFNIAHKLSIRNKLKGFINCPIDKSRFLSEKIPGITEYLGAKNNIKDNAVMLIYNKHLSVCPLTTHIQIKKVSKYISRKNIFGKIESLLINYKKIFKKNPRTAILGLNPHNFEMRVNSEEKVTLIPIIKRLKRKKYNISGPIPSDTVFVKKIRDNYDLIIGMYHDQVLSPFKAIYGFDAINITLGLKYLRVSPDHGVGKNIINKRLSNSESLRNCITFLKSQK